MHNGLTGGGWGSGDLCCKEEGCMARLPSAQSTSIRQERPVVSQHPFFSRGWGGVCFSLFSTPAVAAVGGADGWFESPPCRCRHLALAVQRAAAPPQSASVAIRPNSGQRCALDRHRDLLLCQANALVLSVGESGVSLAGTHAGLRVHGETREHVRGTNSAHTCRGPAVHLLVGQAGQSEYLGNREMSEPRDQR